MLKIMLKMLLFFLLSTYSAHAMHERSRIPSHEQHDPLNYFIYPSCEQTIDKETEKGSHYLFIAIKSGNYTTIAKIIKRPHDINAYLHGYTPLGFFLEVSSKQKIERGLDIAKILLSENQLDINCRSIMPNNEKRPFIFEILHNPSEFSFKLLNLALTVPGINLSLNYNGMSVIDYTTYIKNELARHDPNNQLPWAKENHDLLVRVAISFFK